MTDERDRGVLHIAPTPEEAVESLVEFFVMTVAEAIAVRGEALVALSGGSSPKPLYELLASQAFRDRLEWERIQFFIVDERYVPDTSSEHNGRMLRETLFAPLQIKEEQLHLIDTSIAPEAAAEHYATIVRGNDTQFDLVLLGLGADGHTASLFPHTSALEEQKEPVAVIPQTPVRITMTAPLINRSRVVAFLVYGAGKSEAVHRVLRGDREIEECPAQLISPESGDCHWFLDQAAATTL